MQVRLPSALRARLEMPSRPQSHQPNTLESVFVLIPAPDGSVAARDAAEALGPLFAELVSASTCQIFRGHHNVKLAIRVEYEEPRLRKRRDLGWIFQIND